MKKNLFLFLLMFICVFFLCISYADSEYGTNVEYIADGYEDFQITVPAKLAPSEKGYVVLEGTWDSNSIVSISADEKVDLKNTFNSNDVRSLNVNFNGINRVGNDFSSQKYKTSISVDDMSDDVLFGTWKGTFNYYVETLDANYLFADYIILPKLPELDEEEYPYAVMKYYNFTKEEAEELLEHDVLEDNLFFVDLCYYDEPVYYRENGNNSELVVLNSTGNVCFFYTESQELADFFEIGSVGKWSDASYMDFEEPTSINMDSDDVIWSNKDIVYKDNENLVFNYASNPKKIISFSVSDYGSYELTDRVFYAYEGMTWGEWINSDFAPKDLSFEFHLNSVGNVVLYHDTWFLVDSKGEKSISSSNYIVSCHYLVAVV